MLARRFFSAVYAFGLLGAFAAQAGAADKGDPQVRLVAALYRDYAAEAVLDGPIAARQTLFHQPKNILAHYFSARLVALIRKDQQCAKRTREICRLDFLPIWDAQDPLFDRVKLQRISGANRVLARLSHATQESRELQYFLQKTPQGWRITDISYGAKRPSLVRILTGLD